MKICGVISEFNPFHNGHKYLLDKIKEYGFDAVICVMSSNFVQRGEYASFDSKRRAEAAIAGGVDLVLSLPFPWSCATAELFARGAVNILNSLGCVDAIAFGSESGDLGKIQICADCLLRLKANDIKAYQKKYPNLSYAEARQLLAESLVGNEVASLLSSPNDILAIEYLKAIKYFNASFEILPILRTSSTHDGSVIDGNICSSSHIRNLIENSKAFECNCFLPQNSLRQLDSYRVISKKSYFDFLSGAVLSKEPGSLSEISEIGGGFEFAIYKEMLVSNDYDELFEKLKSRHLTDTKIRRALLFASLNVTKKCFTKNPFFTEVLAASNVGRNILGKIRGNSDLAVLSKVGNIKKASDVAKEQFEMQRKAEMIFEKLKV